MPKFPTQRSCRQIVHTRQGSSDAHCRHISQHRSTPTGALSSSIAGVQPRRCFFVHLTVVSPYIHKNETELTARRAGKLCLLSVSRGAELGWSDDGIFPKQISQSFVSEFLFGPWCSLLFQSVDEVVEKLGHLNGDPSVEK